MSTSLINQIANTPGFGKAIEAGFGSKRNRRVLISASVGAFQRMVQVASTLLVMPLLLKVLGPSRFGIWGAAASLAWLSGLVDIGSGSALVTLVARSSTADGSDQARRHVRGALSIGVWLTGLALVAAVIAFVAGGARAQSAPYLIAAIGLALNLPLNSGNNVWMALQKGYVSGAWELVQTVLTTAGLFAAAAVTTDVRVFVAVVYLGLLLANLGSLIHLFVRHPELRPERLSASWLAMREVASQGVLYFILAVAGGASFMLDNVLALSLLGPEASARMTIALRICVTAVGALAVISQPLWPAFADAAENADHSWIIKVLLRGSALLVALSIAGSCLLLVYGEGLLRWWLHTNLGIGRGLLLAIAAWVVVQSGVRIPVLLLNGLSVLRYQVAAVSAATGVALVMKLALAPYFGVAGILWATTMTTLLVVIPACVWRIRFWARLPLLRSVHAHGNLET
jgi:O-antigen/teichoic acid export membrane protein